MLTEFHLISYLEYYVFNLISFSIFSVSFFVLIILIIKNFKYFFKADGKYDDAIIQFQNAISIEPSNLEAHLNLGVVYIKTKQKELIKKAKKEFETCVRLDNSNRSAHYNLAITLKRDRKFKKAVESFQKGKITNFRKTKNKTHFHTNNNIALKIDPSFTSARYNLANCFLEQGKYYDACAEYRQVLQQQPGNMKVHYNLGVALEKLEMKEDSDYHFKLSMKNDGGTVLDAEKT